MTKGSSALQKALRAVDGDEWFPKRVEVACTLQEVEYTRKLALQIAMGNAESIEMVQEPDYVDTSGITDAMIFATIASLEPSDSSVED